MQITPHFTLAEINRASSPVEETWFRDRPYEFGLRMAAVFSRLELFRLRLNSAGHTSCYRVPLTSYLRSIERNHSVGGKEDSRHLYAIASDFQILSSATGYHDPLEASYIEGTTWITPLLDEYFDYWYTDEDGDFIHADLRDTFPTFEPSPFWKTKIWDLT